MKQTTKKHVVFYTNMGVVEFLQNKKAEWNIPDDYTIQGVDAYRQIIVTKGEMK